MSRRLLCCVLFLCSFSYADSDLEKLYDKLNQKHFAGALSRASVKWKKGLIKDRVIARTERWPEVYKIEIDDTLRTLELVNYTELSLLHEMAHIKCWPEQGTEHGSCWKDEMRRLAREGAFDEIW